MAEILKFDMAYATFTVKGRVIRSYADAADGFQINHTDPSVEVVQGINMAAYVATNKGGCQVVLNLLQGSSDAEFLDDLAKQSKDLKSFTPFEGRYKDTISGETYGFTGGIIPQRSNVVRGNAHNNTQVTIQFLKVD